MLASTDNIKSVWQSTKQSLTSMHGEVIDVVGRDEELETVESFVQSCIETNAGSSLYVAGAPGCGKSAVMHVVVEKYKKGIDKDGKPLPKVHTLFINCLQLDGVEELRSRVQEKRDDINSKENKPAKKRRGGGRTTRSTKNKIVEDDDQNVEVQWLLVIADELDQLRGITDAPIFNDPYLIFIGVSNRLDLSDKVAPTPRRSSIANKRLSSAAHAPSFMIGGSILNFKPYTVDQLTQIVKTRLAKVKGAIDLFEPMALMFCTRRVAASSGDARQALDLVRRAMDVAVMRVNPDTTDLEPIPGTKVTAIDASHVVNSVFGSALNDVSAPSSGAAQNSGPNSGPGLPLHERIALTAIINCITNAANLETARLSIGGRTPGRKSIKAADSNCPLMRVYATYSSQCREHKIDPLNQSDFTDVCGRLADKRLVAVVPPPPKKPLDGPSINLRVTPAELKDFLAKHSLCNLMMVEEETA